MNIPNTTIERRSFGILGTKEPRLYPLSRRHFLPEQSVSHRGPRHLT
jgi:hypothetical protein